MTRWKSGRETILCDREEEKWNREERGEKESERPAPTRQLSWYSMTSNNSQKLSTTERVIKSKQYKYFSYNRDREWYIVVYDIRCQLGFVCTCQCSRDLNLCVRVHGPAASSFPATSVGTSVYSHISRLAFVFLPVLLLILLGWILSMLRYYPNSSNKTSYRDVSKTNEK